MATMKGVVLLPEGTTGILLRGPPTPMNARLIYARTPESMHILIESYACQFSFWPEAIFLMHINIPEHIETLLERERRNLQNSGEIDDATITEFFDLRIQLEKVFVNFSGGIQKECWRVTRSNGSYSVVFMPEAGYFSLCVDSALGPLDIGVHGPAIRCFSSV